MTMQAFRGSGSPEEFDSVPAGVDLKYGKSRDLIFDVDIVWARGGNTGLDQDASE